MLNLGWAVENYNRVKKLHENARTTEDKDRYLDAIMWYRHKMVCDKKHRPDSADPRVCQVKWWEKK